jgi:hypothetical protein
MVGIGIMVRNNFTIVRFLSCGEVIKTNLGIGTIVIGMEGREVKGPPYIQFHICLKKVQILLHTKEFLEVSPERQVNRYSVWAP